MKNKGFSLVEMIVSLAIFSVVAVVAVGALVRVMSANRQSQAIQASVNTITLALETMTREMRVGGNFNCQLSSAYTPPSSGLGELPCSLQTNNSGLTVSFNSSESKAKSPGPGSCNLVYAYRFATSPTDPSEFYMYKAQQTSCEVGISNSDFYPIISSSIHLTGYSFGDYKADPLSFSWAYIRLRGYAGGAKIKDQSRFDVQTSVSQRNVVSSS